MNFLSRYIYLFYCILVAVCRTVVRWLIQGPKFGTWSLWLEIEVTAVIESIKVFDERTDFSWEEIRFMQDQTAKWCFPHEAFVTKVKCNGVRGEFVTSKAVTQPKTTVLYLHGGGYCVGSCKSYRKPVANLSRATQSRFLVLDYGRAPENPYPFALEQVVEAYKWLLGQGVDASKIAVAGDSAGGGLAAALLIALRDRGVPLPSCAVLMSPWTDLTPNSCMQNSKLWSCSHTEFNPDNLAVRFARSYLAKADPKYPLISPYYADLNGLPPMLIMAGGDEALLHDIERFHERCKEHELEVTLHVADNMPHVYQILHQGLHGDIDSALEHIGRFIQQTVQ